MPREVLLAARDPRHDVLLADGQPLHCATDGQAFAIQDDLTGQVRDTTIDDIRTIISLMDALPELDCLWNSVASREIDATIQGLEVDAITLECTAKHVQSGSPRDLTRVPPLIDMLEVVAGASLFERPIYSVVYDTIAPLQQESGMVDVCIELVRHGVLIVVLPMPLMGQTAPMSIAGVAVVTLAEILSTAVILQLAQPGCSVIAGPSAAVSDLRTGSMLAGAPELGLQQLATLAMCRDFGFPTLGGGTTDARAADYQAGAEAQCSDLCAVAAEADAILMPGLLNCDTTASLAKLVLDCDLIGGLKRLAREEIITDATCLLDDILTVGPGGHFLTCRSTRRLAHEGAVWQPRVFQREGSHTSPTHLIECAVQKAHEMLDGHEVPPLDDSVRASMWATVRKHADRKGARVASLESAN